MGNSPSSRSNGERLSYLEGSVERLAQAGYREHDEIHAEINTRFLERQEQLDRRFGEAAALQDEKLDGVRRELEATNRAQQEATTKAEEAAQHQIEAITDGIERSRRETSEASDRYRREVAKRLETLERGEAGSEGERRYKASQIAWIGAAVAVLTLIVYTLIVFLPAAH